MHHENGCCIRAVTWQNLHIRNVVWSSLDMNWVAILHIHIHKHTHTHTHTLSSTCTDQAILKQWLVCPRGSLWHTLRSDWTINFFSVKLDLFILLLHRHLTWLLAFILLGVEKPEKIYTLWAPFTSHILVYEIGRPYMTSQMLSRLKGCWTLRTQMGVNVRLWINMECPHCITSWRKLSLNLFHI